MSKIIISSKAKSPRLSYVCDFLFKDALDLPYAFQIDETLEDQILIDFPSSSKSLRLPHTGLLFEKDINKRWQTFMIKQLIALCKDSTANWQQYDLLSIIFFLLSRYEEYTELGRDQHNRFLAISSCLHFSSCIEIPIVDQIVAYIKNRIQFETSIKITKSPTRLISTIDVDFPWYRKNLKFPYFLKKKKLINNIDPYETYDEIINFHEELNIKPIFFFLVSGSSQYEKVNRYRNSAYANLVKTVATKAQIGIHPPYKSAVDAQSMSSSFEQYQKINGETPRISRQHFLRLKLPTTYRLLIQHGISDDYSLGFAERVGFRAGTARSFYWYDLEKEQTTALRLTPLIAMDVTLKNYMKYTPAAALSKLKELHSTITLYGGNMVLLWHNSSLSNIDNWSEWSSMYYEFITFCSKQIENNSVNNQTGNQVEK